MSTYGSVKDSKTEADEHVIFNGLAAKRVAQLNALVPEAFDYIALGSYASGNPGLVEYKSGGASGTLVATLTLTYSGDDLTSVTRT